MSDDYKITIKPFSYVFTKEEVDDMEFEGRENQRLQRELSEIRHRLSTPILAEDGQWYVCTPKMIQSSMQSRIDFHRKNPRMKPSQARKGGLPPIAE